MKGTRIVVLILLASGSALAGNGPEVDCAALDAKTNSEGTWIPGYMAIHEVVGEGRLQFYSAPDRRCIMPGVFIIPKDEVIAHLEYQGYTSVMYLKRGGGDVSGWVDSARLRGTGKGISPRQ